MNTYNPLKKVLRAAVGALLVALLPMSSALAALPAMPSSGTCAMLVTQAVPFGANVGSTGYGPTGYNITAVLTFNSISFGTLEYYNTQVTYTSNGIQVGTATGTTPANPLQFSLTQSTELTGSYVLTVTVNSQTLAFNVTPTNGGKTLLIQGRTEPFSGVCQF